MLNYQLSVLLFLCFSITSVFTQSVNYEPLKSQGQLPLDLTSSPQEKYQQTLRQNRAAGTANEDATESFLLETTYLFDNILRSGAILYNDPLGQYVNEVLQVVLAANPNLTKKKPRVYILKSTEVNAFAVDQGIIFVSLGLLAQLENEAQLAFILSHELVHIAKEHALDGFLEASKIEEAALEEELADGKDFEMVAMMKNSYSRDQEIEADKIGAGYFIQTNYSYENLSNVFEILRYANLPFDQITFDYSSLEKGSIRLPEAMRLDTIAAISVPEEKEEESTHPAIDKRIIQLSDFLYQKKLEGRTLAIVSAERFEASRKRARMELPHLHLQQQELPQAIYVAHLLAQAYNENDYSQEVIGKALYGLAKFKNNKQWRDLGITKWKNVEGEWQRVFHLVNNLRQEEIAILALAYNYDLYRRQTDNNALRAILVDLFAELYVNHSIESLAYFKASVLIYKPRESLDTTVVVASGIAEIDKKDQSSTYYKDKEEWKLHVLAEVLSDSFFVSLAEEGFAYGRARSEEIAYYDRSTREGRKNSKEANRRRKRRGRSLGVKKAIVINPVYVHLERNKEGDMKINRELSESQRSLAIDALDSSAEVLDMKLTYLDASELTTEDAEKLNDIALAKQWISTQFDAEEFIYHAYDKTATDQLAEKYGTPYIISMILVSGKSRKGRGLLGNNSESIVFVMIFDLRTGRRSLVKSKILSRYLTKTYMQSELYHALFQISKTR